MSNNRVSQVSDTEFSKIVSQSKTIREALVAMGLSPKGDNYKVFTRRCKRLGLSYNTRDSNQIALRKTIIDDDIIMKVKSVTSVMSLLKSLGLNKDAGSNVRWVKQKIQDLKIDTTHFTGKTWSKGKKLPHKKNVKDYLSNKQTISSYRLKSRLISEGIFQHQCSDCNMTQWKGQPIPLELDHIDGNHEDNSLSNLRLLCPNCHAFTPTYRGKNVKK